MIHDTLRRRLSIVSTSVWPAVRYDANPRHYLTYYNLPTWETAMLFPRPASASKFILTAPSEPSRVHQYRPIHQSSASDRHPARRRLDQRGMRHQEGQRQPRSLVPEYQSRSRRREKKGRRGLTTSMPVRKRPKSTYAELNSGERSSARAHREQIELGTGARTNVKATKEMVLFRMKKPEGDRRTDRRGGGASLPRGRRRG